MQSRLGEKVSIALALSIVLSALSFFARRHGLLHLHFTVQTFKEGLLGPALQLVPNLRWEMREQLALYSVLRQGDRLLNVGGGAGSTCILAEKIVGSSGKVVCVEPDPGHMDVIKKNRDRLGANFDYVAGFVQPIGNDCSSPVSVACFTMNSLTNNSKMPFTALFIDCDGCMNPTWFTPENLFQTRTVVYEREGKDVPGMEAALRAASFSKISIPETMKLGVWLRVDNDTALSDRFFALAAGPIFVLELWLHSIGGTVWIACCTACWCFGYIAMCAWDVGGGKAERNGVSLLHCFPSGLLVIFAYTCLTGIPEPVYFWSGACVVAVVPLLPPQVRCLQKCGCCCAVFKTCIVLIVGNMVMVGYCYKDWMDAKRCMDWDHHEVPSTGTDFAVLVYISSIGLLVCLGRVMCAIAKPGIDPRSQYSGVPDVIGAPCSKEEIASLC